MGLSERQACSIVGADRTMVRYRYLLFGQRRSCRYTIRFCLVCAEGFIRTHRTPSFGVPAEVGLNRYRSPSLGASSPTKARDASTR